MLYMHLKVKNHGSLSLTSRVKNASGVDYTRQIPYHQMIYLMSGSSVHQLSQNPMEDTPTSRKRSSMPLFFAQNASLILLIQLLPLVFTRKGEGCMSVLS